MIERDEIFISVVNQNMETMELKINGATEMEFMVDHLNTILKFLGFQNEVKLDD